MLQQALILTAQRDYAATVRQYLSQAVSTEVRIDVETDPLRAMQLSPQQYDLILLDALIGNMDGFQWMRVMKRQAFKTRFIVISEEPSEFFRFQAYQNGADLFLLRPHDEAAWSDALSQILRIVEPAPIETASSAEGSPVSLGDLISTECLSGRSVIVQIDVIGNTGDVFIHQGEVYHAQCSGFSGERAFQAIIRWPQEEMRTQIHQLNHTPPRTIERSLSELMQQAAGVPDMGEAAAVETPITVTTAGLPEAVQPPQEMAIVEAPPRVEESVSGEMTPESESASVFESPGLVAHWKINLMGEFIDGSGAIDPSHTSALTYFIYRKMAEVAVALEEDYFNQLTLQGPKYRQELVADLLCVRHALFKTKSLNPAEPGRFISWCHGQGV